MSKKSPKIKFGSWVFHISEDNSFTITNSKTKKKIKLFDSTPYAMIGSRQCWDLDEYSERLR